MDRARNSHRLFISLHFLRSERFDFVFMLCFNNQLDRRSVAPFALSFLQYESFSWISDHCLKIHDSTTSITRKIRRKPIRWTVRERISPNFIRFLRSPYCLYIFCSDFSGNQRWRRQEAPRCRDLHLQRTDDAYEEGNSIWEFQIWRSIPWTSDRFLSAVYRAWLE